MNRQSPHTNSATPAQSLCPPAAKIIVFSVLLIAFITQTILVYADDSHSKQLTPQAIAGRNIWQKNNCQVCHQLYGFGGFLGPDLTNAVQLITYEQFESRLSKGQDQMPVFDLTESQRADLWQFLTEFSTTGIGQARAPSSAQSTEFRSQIRQRVEASIETNHDPLAAQGVQTFFSNTCTACHVLFAQSAIGAPDLSLITRTQPAESIIEVLKHGKLPKMPPTNLDDQAIESILAFFEFLSDHRDELIPKVDNSILNNWRSIPWWEYE